MSTPISRSTLRSFLIAAATAAAPLASAATLYWDGTTSTANADGGAGTWDATTLNWDSLATAGVDTAWVDGSDASFGGTAGTVTVSGTYSLNSLTVVGAYTLTGGTLNLGGKTITVSGTSNSSDVFINSVLAGSGGITIAANGDTTASGGGVGGSLKLGGANTFTGGVTITSGVVNIDSSFGDASNAITLNGGGLVDESSNATFTRNIIIGASGGVARNWGTTTNYTGGISGTGTLRRTDTGTQNYTGNFTGGVSFNNQQGTTTLRGNWLSTGSAFASGGTLSLRGQVYDGAAIVNTGGTLMLASINRNSVQLSATGGSIGLGRTAAMGMGATYNVATNTLFGASTGAWLDSSKFAAGYTYRSSSVSTAPLFGSTALNVAGYLSGYHSLYTGTLTVTANVETSDRGFYAPNASLVLNAQFDAYNGAIVLGSLSGSGNITVNGKANNANGVSPFKDNNPLYVGSVSQNKSVAIVGSLEDSAVIVGSNNTSTTWSGAISNGSWSGGSASFLKRGTGTLTLSGGSAGSMSGGLIVEGGTVVLQKAGAFPGTAYYGTNLAVLRGATLSTNASYALTYNQNLYVMGGTFSYLSGDIYSPNLILDGATVANATAGGTTGGFRFGYNADGYINVLSGLGASTLSGKFQLFGNGRTEFIRVSDGAAARDLVISGNLADDPGYTGLRITKTGLGTMAFTGASSRSGGTTINGGTVEVAAANALGTGAAAGITLGGGTLSVRYDLGGSQSSMAYNLGGGALLLSGNTTAVTQAIGNVTIADGSTTITAAPGAGGTTTVNIGSITRSGTVTRAMVNLSGTATWTTTQANDATKGRLLGVLLNGGFAMNNGSNTIVAYTGTQISGTTISAGATTDYTIGASVTGDLSMAASGTTTVQSLTLDSTAGRTINIGAGNTLRVVDGIFQKTSGVALNFGASGTLTAGSADNTAADLLISATGGMATGTNMTFGSVIANNGTGAVTLVKSGVGDLNLTSGANTYTGGTLINQGRLRVSGDAAVGGASGGAITVNDGGQLYVTGNISKAITLNGGIGAYEAAGYLGAIRLENGVTLSGALTVNNDSQVTTYGSMTATVSGTVTLNGELVKTGAGTLVIGAGSSGNGSFYVKQGTLVYQGNNYITRSNDIFVSSGATFRQVATNSMTGSITLAGGTFEMASYHGSLRNVNLYGGLVLGVANTAGESAGYKYANQDTGTGLANNVWFIGGSARSEYRSAWKIGLNSTRFYVQDATGNAAPDFLVRASFEGTGYFAGAGTTRFARQVFSTGGNSYHTATTYIQPGHTLEVASDGSMGSGTIMMEGGTLRMTSLAGLAEYQITGTPTMNTTAGAGNFIGVTIDNQQHNSSSSGTFGGNTTWSYRGQLVISDASRTLKFSENIDDAAWLRISGTANDGTVVDTVVLNDAGWNTTTTNSITLKAGTYAIDVRAQNGGGGYGPVGGLNGNGVAWDVNNGTNWTSIGVTTDSGVQVYAAGGLSQTLSNAISFTRISDVQVQDATDTVTLSGVVSGAGMLNKTGSGALVLSNASNSISGGITVSGGELRISASGAQGTGSINLLSGSTLTYSGSPNVTFTNPIIAERGDAAISVWNLGTTLTLAQGVDNYASGAATRTIAKQGSGTLDIAGLLTGNHLYNVQGGTLVISATDASRASANVAAGTTLSVTASGAFGAVTNAGTSTLSSTSLGAIINTAGTLTAASATTLGAVTVSGGAVTANAATTVGNLSASAGTLSITSATSAGTVGVSGTGTLNAGALLTSGAITVSGGTLNATALNSTSSGAITVSGGTANLGAGSSYGATSLSNGTLNVGAATLASLNKTGGTLNIGAVGTAATLTATGNSVIGGMLNFDLSNSTSSGNDLLAVLGTANLSGLTGVTFNLTSGALSTGTYTLLTSAGITDPTVGIASVTKSGIASGATRQTYTLSTTEITNALTLTVGGAVGNNTFVDGGNDVWSTNSTDGAWTSTASDQWFFNGDLVTFGDLATASAKTVTVSGDVAPGSLAFTNTSGTTYTLSGAGRITGTTGLTKSGNGRLVLGNTGGNDFTGATTVSNGTLEVGAANALSTSSSLTVSGGTLDVGAIANVATGAVTLSSGTITGTSGSLSAPSVTVNGGSLAANVAGTGTLTFAGTNFTYANTATHTGGTTLSSGSLTIASGGSIAGVFTQSANTTLTVAGTLGGALGVATGATTTVATGGSVGGNVTLAGNATLSNSGTITGSLSLANTSSATNAGTISGGFTLANTASLTSTGSIAGGGTIVSGTSLNTSGTLAGNISNAGTLTFSGSTDRSYAGVISGGGSVVKTGSGTQTLSGTAHAIGSIALQQGRLVLNTGSGSTWNNTVGTASITMSNGTVLQAVNSTSLNGNITIVGDASIQVDSGSTVWKDTSGSLGYATTNATFRKTGAGTLVIATNRLAFGTGSTVVVDGGTLQLNMNIWGGGSIMGSAGLTVNSGGTVSITGYHVFDAYSGFVPVVNGGTITGNGQDVYIGGFNMTGGLVEKSRFVNVSSITTNAASTTAAYAANLSSGATTISVADGSAAVDFRLDPYWNGTTNGTAITKTGAGLMQVALAASGTIALNAGTVQVGAGGTAGTVGNVTAAAGTLLSFNRSDSYNHSATIAGAGAVEQVGAGTLTLSAANSFSGGLTINGGTVALTNATAGGTAGITASNNATLDVATGITAAHTTLAGAGSLTKSGSGALTLTGSNSLSGNLSVTGGTLSLVGSGSLGNGGTVSVAGGATLALGASVNDTQTGAINNSGTLTNAGVTARSVTTSGTVTNTGTLGAITQTAGTVTNTGTLGAITQTAGTVTSTGTVGSVGSTGGNLNLAGNAGAITLGSTSVLNVGGQAATAQLSAGSLTVSGGSILEFELSDAGNTSFYDRLALTGALDLSGLTSAATLKLYSFDRASGARGNATVFNQYASFSLDIITAGSITGSSEIDDGLGGMSPALALDYSGFTNTFTGSWALVAHSGGYRLEYTANIPVRDVNVATLAALSDSAEGSLFLSELGIGQTAQVLRKTGAGQLTVTESLGHIGGTQVNAGSLLLADGASLGTGDVTIASGASLGIVSASGNSGTLANALSGAGNVEKTGQGSLELTGAVATTGTISVSDGTLLANFAPFAGTLDIASSATAEFKGASGQTFAGNLAGAGTARLVSGSTLTVASNNPGFSGTFSVANGTLVLAADNALGSGTADIATGSTVNISGGRTLGSAFTGAGALTKTGNGTATLTGSVAHTGATTVSAGTLKGDFTNASGAISVSSGATLEYAIGSAATRGGSDITGSGSFTKSGNGKLTLSSALGVTGGVSVAGGTLAAADFGTASTVTIGSGATAELNLASSGSLSTVFAGTGTLTKNGNSTLTVGSTGLSTFAGRLLVSEGTVSTAAIANLGTSVASIEINGGRLAVTASGQTIGSTRALTIGASGATIDISSLGQTGTLTVATAITGTGSLTLAGSGNTSASGGGDPEKGIRLTNAASSFVGNITITSGLVSYSSNGVFGNAANRIILNGGGLLDANDQVALSRDVEVQSGGGYVRTWGGNYTWSGALSGTGALNRTDAGTLTHSGDLSGFSGTFNNQAATTLFTGSSAGFGAATVNVTGGTVGFALARLGSATVNLDGGTLRFEDAGSISATSIQLVSGKNGVINTNGFNVVLNNGVTGTGANLEKNGGGTLTLGGTGTASISSAVNAYNGTLEVAGQTVTSATGWVSGGTLKVSSGSYTATSYLMVGTGTLEISGGTLSTAFFRTSEGYYNTNSTISQTGGTFNVTGSTIENERSNSFMLNHWSGTSTYNLSGGTLNVLNTNVNMGWDGNAYVNQSGGTANLRGVNMASGRTNGAAYNLTGGRLNVGVGGITSATNKTVTLGNATLGALANWTGASAMSINSGTTITVDTADAVDGTARTITLSGGISGSGSLTKVGNGTLTLSGGSSMSGAIRIDAGTLNFNQTYQGISGLTVGNGATANFNFNNVLSAGHGSAVAAAITVNGGAVSFASGTEMRIGNVDLNAGTLTFNRGLSSWDVLLANVASGAATISVGGSGASTLNGSGGLHIQGVQNFAVANATGDAAVDLVVSAQLGDAGVYAGGTGGINKTGAGTMSLTNSANSFTGAITVAAGALEVSGSGRLNGGSYAGAITNAGTFSLTSSANQALSGAIDNSGTLNVAGSGATTLSGAVNNTGSLSVASSGATTLSGVVSGSGSLTKSGNGLLTVSGANDRTGATVISAGTVAVTATGSLGSGATTVAGATLTVAAGGSVGSGLSLDNATLGFDGNQTLSVAIAAGSNGATINTGASDVTLASAFTADGSLTKSGNGILTLGASGNSVGSAFNINAGTVAVSSLDAVSGAFNIGANGTLALSLSLASDSAFANTLTGSGILSVSNLGSGILSLSNASGFSAGTVNLLAGTFDNTGFTGKIGLLGGFLASFENFSGAVTIGSALTEAQQESLAAFTGTLEISGPDVTLDITKINSQASLVVGEGATIDFSAATPEQLNRTITLSGNATLQGAESFTGVVEVAAGSNVTIGAGSIGGGTLQVAENATVTITAPITNTVVFDGGTIVGGANLSSLELGSNATLTFGQGGNIDDLAPNAVLTVAGGTVDFAGSSVSATIEFSGGTVSNAENFAGELQVVAPVNLPAGETISFVMDGVIGGTVVAGSNTVIGGNGTFNTLTMGAGSNFSPGSSPGANTVGTLTLNGGSIWTIQAYSAQEEIAPGVRGYDTTNIAVAEGGLGNALFSLAGASSSNRITLQLMTLSNWSDSFGGTPTSLLDVPEMTGYLDFVIATYGDGVLDLGANLSVSALFQFNTTGFYRADGTRAHSSEFSVFEYYNAATGLNQLTLRYSPVPEPSTYGLMLGGLALAAAAYRRRRQAKA